MRIARKVAAVIAMGLCVLFLALCLAGVLGVWLARAPLTAAVVTFLTGAHATLQKADGLAGQVGEGVSDVRDVAAKLHEVAAGASDAAGVLKAIGPVGGLLSSLYEGAARLEDRLAGLDGSARELRQQLGGWLALVDMARARAPVWINRGALAITFALLWLGLGQASLFLHAWAWLRRPAVGLAAVSVAAPAPDQYAEPAPRED
jgi:hypothetical protein